MTVKVPHVPAKRPETEKPTIIDDNTNPQEEAHKKVERDADRAAHKANQTHQQYDQDHKPFTI